MMVGERLVALNATNGALDTAFGTGGFVDIGVNWGGVPLVFKNIVVVGSNNGEVTLGDDPGDTTAYDARTGAKLWTFVSVAQPGDPNHAAAHVLLGQALAGLHDAGGSEENFAKAVQLNPASADARLEAIEFCHWPTRVKICEGMCSACGTAGAISE